MLVGSPGSSGSGHSIRLGTNEDASQHMPVLFPTYAQLQQQQQQQQQGQQPQYGQQGQQRQQPQYGQQHVPDVRRGAAQQPAAALRPAAQVKMRVGTNEDFSQYMPPIHHGTAASAAPQASPFGAADVASMLGSRVDAMSLSPGGPPRRTSYEAGPKSTRDASAAVERSQSHDSHGLVAGPRGSAPMAGPPGGSPRKDGLAPGMAGSPSYRADGARPLASDRGLGFPSAQGSQGIRVGPYAPRSAHSASPPGAQVAAGMGSGGGMGWGAGRQQQAPMPLPTGRQASGGASWDNMNNMSAGSSWSDFDTRSIGSAGGSSARLTEGGGGAECRQFTLAQLAAATDNFSDANLLGRGAFGMVHKGRLLGCQVAVKRLEGGGWQGPSEYRMEVEVLSRMRHPHIVLLMGHCPDAMCLVYEYLPAGSLQDHLNPAGRTGAGRRALSVAERVRVASEVASALLFLHHHDPPIAHRDLKPDNVLLDANRGSKLADVGLARLIADDDNVTARVRGTAGYIDPEEVVTCEISVLSDIYALGLIMLQLLTGEPHVKGVQRLLVDLVGSGAYNSGPSGLARAVDVVLARLDPSAGEWERDVAAQFASLALRCADRQRARRPDLDRELQPALVALAERCREAVDRRRGHMDSQLLCPLSQERMSDPVVAADGFTYERSSIEEWLKTHDSSPVNGQPLPHKFLTPNNTLRMLLNTQG
ncbi:hypothetical protein CLOM_g15409 [Closterium sp. NIES-68]|nr:hypothetical protein CLOM_g15409 [Closterium sp. NIES-68]GJP65663.1 hypothetical protein CLOP_g22530 [Closterium sp. NIES-67]